MLQGNHCYQGSTEVRTHDSNKADFRQSPIRTDLAIAQPVANVIKHVGGNQTVGTSVSKYGPVGI